jgi:hypothetical protein
LFALRLEELCLFLPFIFSEFRTTIVGLYGTFNPCGSGPLSGGIVLVNRFIIF